MNNSLDTLKKRWEKEIDYYLIKAATRDLEDYYPEAQEIIITEFKKRELEAVT